MNQRDSPFLASHTFRKVQLDDISASCLQVGQGQPILLVHGGGTWSYTWRHTIPALAKQFTVYAVDMPGFGLTTSPKFTPTEDYFADFLKHFIDTAIQVPSLSIVGSSWGGGWALRFTEKYPSYVNRLVLLDSAGLFYHSLKRPTFLWNLITIPGLGRLLSRYATTASILKAQYKSLLYDQKKIEKNVGKELLVGLKNPLNRDVLYEYGLRDMWRLTDGALGSITKPTLIIWGKHDAVFPVTDAEVLHSRLSKSKVAIIPNAGHLPHEELPDQVNQLIIRYLSDKDYAGLRIGFELE